jgi:hypothetical protein
MGRDLVRVGRQRRADHATEIGLADGLEIVGGHAQLGRARRLHQGQEPALPRHDVGVRGVLDPTAHGVGEAARPPEPGAVEHPPGGGLGGQTGRGDQATGPGGAALVEPDRGDQAIALEAVGVALPELAELPGAVADQGAAQPRRQGALDPQRHKAVLAGDRPGEQPGRQLGPGRRGDGRGRRGGGRRGDRREHPSVLPELGLAREPP